MKRVGGRDSREPPRTFQSDERVHYSGGRLGPRSMCMCTLNTVHSKCRLLYANYISKKPFQNEGACKTETLPSPAPFEPHSQAAVPMQRKRGVTGECGRAAFTELLNPNSGTTFSKLKIRALWCRFSETTKSPSDNILLTLQIICKFTKYSSDLKRILCQLIAKTHSFLVLSH